VASAVGSRGKEQYLACVHAQSTARVGAIKAEMSDTVAQYLNKIPDQYQYMAAAGGMHGQSTSSACESAHSSNSSARNVEAGAALWSLVKAERLRFNKNRNESHNDFNSQDSIPNKVRDRLAPFVQKSLMHSGMFFPDDENKRIACVPSLTGEGDYGTDLDKRTCDCLLKEVEGLPCSHLIHHAEKVRMPLWTLLDVEDTTEGWRAQYPFYVPLAHSSSRSIFSRLLAWPARQPSRTPAPCTRSSILRYQDCRGESFLDARP